MNELDEAYLKTKVFLLEQLVAMLVARDIEKKPLSPSQVKEALGRLDKLGNYIAEFLSVVEGLSSPSAKAQGDVLATSDFVSSLIKHIRAAIEKAPRLDPEAP